MPTRHKIVEFIKTIVKLCKHYFFNFARSQLSLEQYVYIFEYQFLLELSKAVPGKCQKIRNIFFVWSDCLWDIEAIVCKKMYDLNVSLYIEKCPQWTENELYIYDRFKFWTEIVGGISISVLGMCFNLLAIIVIILMDKRSNIFNYLLICLLATDFAYLFLVVFYEILDHIITSDRWFNLLYPKVIHPLVHIMVTQSIFLDCSNISWEIYCNSISNQT